MANHQVSFKQGWLLLKDSLSLVFKKPNFLVPLFFAWFAVAILTLSTRYYLVPIFEEMTFGMVVLSMFVVLILFTLSIAIASSIMLELIFQTESGNEESLNKAIRETFSKNFLKLVPLTILWSLIWLLILILRALTSRQRRRSERAEPSVRDAARTLSGANAGPFSWLGLSLTMIEKLVRMTVFLAFPAIAWEEKGPFSSLKKSLSIIKAHPIQFLTTYTLTGVVGALLVIPLIPIYLIDDAGVQISNVVWWLVIFYSGAVWTLGIYLEQMSVGLLYLWHYKWEKNGSVGDLTSVQKPQLLDSIHEF